MGVGAAVTARTRDQAFGPREFNPFLGGQEEAVPASLISNSLEFEGIKVGVIDPLPDAEEKDGILVLELLLNQSACAIEVTHHVGERNVVSARLRKDGDGRSSNRDGVSFCFAHGVGLWGGRMLRDFRLPAGPRLSPSPL